MVNPVRYHRHEGIYRDVLTLNNKFYTVQFAESEFGGTDRVLGMPKMDVDDSHQIIKVSETYTLDEYGRRRTKGDLQIEPFEDPSDLMNRANLKHNHKYNTALLCIH